MKIRRWFLAMALASATFPAAAGYTALYGFGDSLSDTGNLYNAVYAASGGTVQVPPPPYWQGHASNGPVALEYLAGALGLSAQPVLLPDGSLNPAGSNFAVMGAATGTVTQSGGSTYNNYMTFRYSPYLPDVGMQDQVAVFGSLTGGMADPGALYFLWGGANDAYLALEDPGIDHDNASVMNPLAITTATAAVNNMAALITALAGMGAHDFLVPNLPDMGRTPDALSGAYGSAYASALTLYSQTFNGLLGATLATLDASPQIDIIPFDTASLFEELLNSGLYDVTTPCMLNPACDPTTTLFWDGVHPTTAFHERLGLAMAAAVVPEPGIVWLLVPGLVLLFLQRRRTTQIATV